MGFLLRQLLTVALASLFTISPSKAASDERSQPVASFQAHVISVIDGDTVDVQTADKQAVRIRLAGIDAPDKRQAFSTAARERLAQLVYDKTVEVEVTTRATVEGRTIARLIFAGRDASFEQVRQGFAMLYRDPDRGVDSTRHMTERERTEFENAELFARQAKVGIWSQAEVVAPWQWRQTN